MRNYLEEHGYRAYLDAAKRTLKPCPICNGEVKYTSGVHCGDDFENGTLRCDSCGLEKRVILYGYGNYDPLHAFDAWNTRAERTCVLEDIPYEPGCWEGVRCGSCGVTDEDTDLTGNYCPNCGAKVVKR